VGATAVTNAGSMLTALAFPLAAIGLLGASPADLAVLRVAGLAPGLALGPWLGRVVDRFPRRRVLAAAELVGAASVGGVAAAHALGLLSLATLAAAFTLGAASFAFGVARVAIVPGLVGQPRVAEANAALRTAGAASEGVAFAAGGALVQALGVPAALGLDTLSFLGSAFLIRGLPDEAAPEGAAGAARARGARLADGLRRVVADPVLLALAAATALVGLSFSIASVVYLLFATEGLGFAAGVLGLVFAVGSVSSVAGGVIAPRVIQRLGPGRSMVGGRRWPAPRSRCWPARRSWRPRPPAAPPREATIPTDQASPAMKASVWW
jgi:Major Facilitator Superfamily